MTKIVSFSNNGGKKWERPKTPPHGYRSCVEFLDKETIVTCGLNGVDYLLMVQEFLFNQQRRFSCMQVCKDRQYSLPCRRQWKNWKIGMGPVNIFKKLTTEG
jgi:hypothetical protein